MTLRTDRESIMKESVFSSHQEYTHYLVTENITTQNLLIKKKNLFWIISPFYYDILMFQIWNV